MVLKNKSKGQGLVEFAFMLPILLLLLLGIIEGGRIIWAFVTIQNAAREAARYAVTGRPFRCDGDPINDPDPTVYCDNAVGTPWSSDVPRQARLQAIANVATRHGLNLTDESHLAIHEAGFNTMTSVPSAFGVMIIGQTAVSPTGIADDPGDPGWNVRVDTYYNVVMLDPIYDAIMGGQSIHLQGSVELQNEGIDAANQGNYQGGITYQNTDCPPNCGSGNTEPYIIVQDEFGDFKEPAGGQFAIFAEQHLPFTTYTLNFGSYSTTFTTNNLGSAQINYVISVNATPSPDEDTPTYPIYTSIAGTPVVASCAENNAPCFVVTTAKATINASNKDREQGIQPPRWPISSSIPIWLLGHDLNQNYTLTFDGDQADVAPGDLFFDGALTNIIPTDGSFGTNLGNKPAYYIATNHITGALTIASAVTATTVELNLASIAIAGETVSTTHPAGDILGIVLRDHAPKQEYTVHFDDGVTPPADVAVDENGNLATYYIVPPGVQTPGASAVPVEIYVLDRGRGTNPNKIARRFVQVDTPAGPFINVPGGSTWPAGSPIKIQIRQHAPNTVYDVRLEQGAPNSPSFSEPADIPTITTDGSGNFTIDHIIPISYSGNYVIRSFTDTTTSMVADFAINVTSQPNITIDNGNRWPPGATITIRLHSHVPLTPYEVWLDRFGPYEQFLGTVITDEFGQGVLTYTIPNNMATNIDPGYDLHSYFGSAIVADNATLEVNPADLEVTSIELPNVSFNMEIPITLTIRNNGTVSITDTYFDNDIYIDPLNAPNLDAPLPPGQYKRWVNNMPPNGTITIQEDIVLFGEQTHEVYGRADTSDLVVETDPNNNLASLVVDGSCPVRILDEFNSVDPLAWNQTEFGDSAGSSSQTANGGTLALTNQGSSALMDDDNGSNAGYHFMHQTVGSGPFEVAVRLDQTPPNGSSGYAGLEIRADETDGTSTKLLFALRSDNQLRVLSRPNGGSVNNERTQDLGNGVPIWLRITRNGDAFVFEYSTDNSETLPENWTNFEELTFTLPGTVEVGLINAPGSNSTTYDAHFEHFSLCATSVPGGTLNGSRCGQVEENGNGLVVVDAVNTILNQAGGGHTWDTTQLDNVLGEPSMEGLQALPDSGNNLTAGSGPHTTYQVNVQTTGTYYVWVAGWGPDANGDSVEVGLNGSSQGTVTGFPTGGSSPAWQQMPGSVNLNAGIHTLDLWPAEDGVAVFKIMLTQDSSFVPPPDGMSQSACSIIVQPHIPPDLQECTNPIQKGNFEGLFPDVTAAWGTTDGATAFSTTSYQSNRAAAFPAFNHFDPSLYQTVSLPTWILSNTTAIVKYDIGVSHRGANSPNPNDLLRVSLSRASDGHVLTDNVIADGDDTPNLNTTLNPPTDWKPNQTVDLFAGLNPLSFLEGGDSVELTFYSPDPNPGGAGNDTEFFLDNISLTFCTTQPRPEQDPALGKISGKTQRFGQLLEGVTVWAYAYDGPNGPGPVFQTQSIQGGAYSFYNLPPGQYLIYASITDSSGTFFGSRLVNIAAGGSLTNIYVIVETS